jgi:hypothetical protein
MIGLRSWIVYGKTTGLMLHPSRGYILIMLTLITCIRCCLPGFWTETLLLIPSELTSNLQEVTLRLCKNPGLTEFSPFASAELFSLSFFLHPIVFSQVKLIIAFLSWCKIICNGFGNSIKSRIFTGITLFISVLQIWSKTFKLSNPPVMCRITAGNSNAIKLVS